MSHANLHSSESSSNDAPNRIRSLRCTFPLPLTNFMPMIVRGSLERLTPVLMTALVAAFALTPLLLAADAPGKEILHPVAVVIFALLLAFSVIFIRFSPKDAG